MVVNLYRWKEKDETFYIWTGQRTCHKCKKEIQEDIANMDIHHAKGEVHKFLYHFECYSDFPWLGFHLESMKVLLLDDVPPDALPVILKYTNPRSFPTGRDSDVFASAERREQGVLINDKTRLSSPGLKEIEQVKKKRLKNGQKI